MGYRDYSTAKGHIVDATGKGDFTTIAAALTAATSGQTIFIRPGTYTENPALKAGVNLTAFECDATTPNVTIVGKCTFASAGTVTITGIRLQTNSDFFLSVTGTAASIVNLVNCYLNCSNNTGIQFTTANTSAQIICQSCTGNLGTTGIAAHTSSSTGALSYNQCTMNNSGGSSTASSNSAGSVGISWGGFFCPLSVSGGTLIVQWSFINTTAQNATCITSSGTGTIALHGDNDLSSGTASSLSIGTGTICNSYGLLTINSSNTNAITGLGTIQYTLISYNGSSSTNNVSTQSTFTTQPTLSSTSFAVQQVRANKTAAQTVTSNIAAITTQPTTSNGTSVISVSITPTNSSHVLVLEGNITFTSGGNFVSAYFIQNATGNGFGVAWQTGGAANQPLTIPLRYYMTAGTTSAIQFDLYITVQSGGNVFVNANTSGTQLSGGAAFTSLVVTEYTS